MLRNSSWRSVPFMGVGIWTGREVPGGATQDVQDGCEVLRDRLTAPGDDLVGPDDQHLRAEPTGQVRILDVHQRERRPERGAGVEGRRLVEYEHRETRSDQV